MVVERPLPFLGHFTTARILNFPVEDRRIGVHVYDVTTLELRSYGVDGEAYPSILWATAGAGLPMLDGAGNPNGVVAGLYGQLYRDTNTDIIYVCISNPAGNSWTVT